MLVAVVALPAVASLVCDALSPVWWVARCPCLAELCSGRWQTEGGWGPCEPRTGACGAGVVLASWVQAPPPEPMGLPQHQGDCAMCCVELYLQPGDTIVLACEATELKQEDSGRSYPIGKTLAA